MSAPAVPANLDGLVTLVDGRPHLVGGRCDDCGTDTFPQQRGCPRCGSQSTTAVALPTEGTVWTWTVQRFAPKPPFRAPKSYEPFALAYVDLGTVRVESRLAGKQVGTWRIGDPVQLVVGPLDAADPEWQAFWFEPVSGSAGTASKERG